MPTTYVNTPDGGQLGITHPEGASEQDILSYAKLQYDSGVRGTAPDQTTVGGQVGEFFKGIPAGFGKAFIGAGEGLGALASEFTPLGYLDYDDALADMADRGRQAIDESFLGAAEGYQDSNARAVGEGLGSFASFLTPLGVAKAVGAGANVARGIQLGGAGSLAVGSGAGEASQRLRAFEDQTGQELTGLQRKGAIGLGGVVGLTELAPVERLLGSVGREFKRPIMDRLIAAAQQGGVEGFQEAFAQVSQNAIEAGIYNPDQEILDSALQSAIVGGEVGALAELLRQAAPTGRRSVPTTRPLTEQQIEEERVAREEEEQRLAGVAEGRERRAETREPQLIEETLTGADVGRIAKGIVDRGQLPEYDSVSVFRTRDDEGNEVFALTDRDNNPIGLELRDRDSANMLAHALNGRIAERARTFEADAAIDQLGLSEEDTAELKQMAREVYIGGREVGPFISYEDSVDVDTGNPIVLKKEDGVVVQTITSAPTTARQQAADEKAGRRVRKTARFETQEQAIERAEALNEEQGSNPSRYTPPAGEIDALLNDETLTPEQRATVEAFNSPEAFSRMLQRAFNARNIEVGQSTRDLNTNQALRTFVQSVTGKKLRKDQGALDLSPEERAQVLRTVQGIRRLKRRQELPDFQPKKYDLKQARAFRDLAAEEGEAPSVMAVNARLNGLEGKGQNEPLSEQGYAQLVKEYEASRKVEEQQEESPILALPSPDDRWSAIRKAVSERLERVGLSGDVAAKLVDRYRRPNTGELIETTGGAFDPVTSEVTLAVDTLEETIPEGATDEQVVEAVLDTLNHEMIHAMRKLDIITQQEFDLLVRLAKQYGPANQVAGSTYLNEDGTLRTFAERVNIEYADRNARVIEEESVAELVKYGFKNEVIDQQGKQFIVGGKPRTLFNRIVNFIKEMYGFARDQDARDFGAFLDAVNSGEVGARERGQIRTPYQVQRNVAKNQRARAIAEAQAQPEITQEEQDEGAEAPAPRTRRPTRQQVADQPDIVEFGEDQISEEALEDRTARAREQGFDTDITYYHGSPRKIEKRFRTEQERTGIKKFKGSVSPNIAGHFTKDIEFANVFTRRVDPDEFAKNQDFTGESYIDYVDRVLDFQYSNRDDSSFRDSPTIYPVYLRGVKRSEWNKPGGVFALYNEGAQEAIDKMRKDFDRVQNFELTPEEEKIPQIVSLDFPTVGQLLERLDSDRAFVSWGTLEELAPLMQLSGFRGYMDIENAPAVLGIPVDENAYTGVAMFNPADIKGKFANYNPEGMTQEQYEEDIMFDRTAPRGTINKAVDRAKEKFSDVSISSEEEFFGLFWPQLIRATGGTVGRDRLRLASRRAVRDIADWVRDNPKYNDYYAADMQAVRMILERDYGPLTDGQFRLYQFLNGVTSPGTALPINVSDALNMFDLYMTDGNFDAIKMGLTKKGNPTVKQSPFLLSAATAPTKARSAKAFDKIVAEQGGLQEAFDFLFEPVPLEDLKKFKKGLGYAGVSDVGIIKGLVQEATGQDELIPRMFYLGPKVGAYTMNLMGDSRYTTVDVWESRFIRSYIDNMFDENTGITETKEEADIFREFSNEFAKEFEKQVGYKADPSTLQAMRWFYMINASREAGYTGSSTNETISELTEKRIERVRDRRNGGRRAGTTESSEEILFDLPAIRTSPNPAIAERIRRRERRIASRREAPLEGAPAGTAIEGKGPDAGLNAVAEEYAESKGIPFSRQTQYAEVVPERAERIAQAYEDMAHDPTNPEVLAAYEDLIAQTIEQYNALIDGGYTFEFFDSTTDPYKVEGKSNPFEAMRDLRNNKRMAVYGTYDGYGTEGITASDRNGNPLLIEVGIQWPDQRGVMHDVTANDLFRAVHDALGHGIEGAGFRARGEENAWQAHRRLFTGPALGALTSETRGQNNWLNFGPFGASNQTADVDNTVFGEQKAGLMPEWTWSEGVVDADEVMFDRPAQATTATPSELQRAVREATEFNDTFPDFAIPYYGEQASPEALFVAQNPDRGLEEDVLYDTPSFTPGQESAVDKLVGKQEPGERKTVGRQILEMIIPTKAFQNASWTAFSQNFVNKYAAWEKTARENKDKLGELLADSGSYQAMVMADRAKAVTAKALTDGVPVYRDGGYVVEDFVHKGRKYNGLIEIMSLVQNPVDGDLTREAQAYAMVMRSKYLDSKGKVTPVTPEAKQEVLALVESLTKADGSNPIKDWHETYQAYNAKVVDFMLDTGLLNEQMAGEWADSAYIPFYRAAEMDANGKPVDSGLKKEAQGVFGGLTSLSRFTPYKGSEKVVNRPMTETVAANLSAAVEMGMRNVAQQRVMRDMQKLGMARQVKNNASGNVVSFKVDGKTVKFEVDDALVYQSLLPLESDSLVTWVGRTLGMPADLLRALVTKDPGFMAANLMRDTLSAFVTSGSKFVPLVDSVKGFADGMDLLERRGVVGGYDFKNDPDNLTEFYNKEVAKLSGTSWNPFTPFRKAWDALDNVSTRSDAATRMAVYKDVLARTGNDAEATFQAIEILNFGRHGRHPLVRVLTATIPFLNARIQGLSVLKRSAFGQYSANSGLTPSQIQKSFFVRGAMLTALTALYYMWVSDDEEYKEASNEDRENYWMIPMGEGRPPIQIPIPFEVGLIFKTIPEVMMRTVNEDLPAKDAREVLFRAFTTTTALNPPQVIAPMAELWANKSFYTGRQIVPEYMKGLESFLQYKDNTSPTAIALGETGVAKALDLSPLEIESLIRGYTATLGSYVVAATDAAVKAAQEGEQPEMPTMPLENYPILRRFFAPREGGGLRNQAYELYYDTQRVVTTINKLQEQGDYDQLAAYMERNQPLIDARPSAKAIKKSLDKYREQKRAIYNMPAGTISAERKRELIDQLDKNINQMLKILPTIRSNAYSGG